MLMETIHRRLGYTHRDWTVYTQAEADAESVEYKPWREAKPGEWALSDDGYVAEVVRIDGPYRDGRGRDKVAVVLPYARHFSDLNHPEKDKPLRFEEHREPKPWLETEMATARAKQAIAVYAQLLVDYGKVIPEEKMLQLGRMYRPDQVRPEATLKRLLRTQEAKTMVARELAKLLSSKGITADDVVDNYVRQMGLAEQKGQLAVAKSINDKFAEMLSMKPDQKHVDRPNGIDVEWDRVLEENLDLDGDMPLLE